MECVARTEGEMSEAGFAFLCGESKMSLGYGFGGLGDRHNTKYPGTRLLASPCTRLRCLGFFSNVGGTNGFGGNQSC